VGNFATIAVSALPNDRPSRYDGCMDLHASALRALRDALLARGQRDTISPIARCTPSTEGLGPDDLAAIVARVSPTCEALFLLMSADDDCAAGEYFALRGAIRGLTDGALGSRALDELLSRFRASLKREGRERRMSNVAAQLAADRADAEATFMLGAALMLADGAVSEVELSTLEELGESMGLSARRRRELLRPGA